MDLKSQAAIATTRSEYGISRTHKLMVKWTLHTDIVWRTKFTLDGSGSMTGSEDKISESNFT